MTPTVFLCEPSGLCTWQRSLSDQWHERLFGLGVDIDQIRCGAYEQNPWIGLLHHIGSADGVLVLGFSQLLVSGGTWRGGSDEERVLDATWSSSWLHIEAGMALAIGLPVLVAPESKVSEGVFAASAWVGPLRGTSLEHPDPALIDDWAAAVAKHADSRLSTVR